MAICPTCGKTFDERSFHVLASGQTFDTAECALLALEGAGPAAGLAALPAPVAGGPFVRPAPGAMMRSMRTRLPFGLLLAALAVSAILSAYLWLRALGAGPPSPVSSLSVPPAEHRSVATLPGIVRRAPATARRAAPRKHAAVRARAVPHPRVTSVRAVAAGASSAPSAELVSAPAAPSASPPSPPASPPKPKAPSTPPSSSPPPSPPPSSPPPTPPPAAPSPPPAAPQPPAAPAPQPAPTAAATTPEETQPSPPVESPPEAPLATEPSKPGWGCGDKNHTHTGPPGNGGSNGSPC